LFRQVGADLQRVRLDEGDGALQLPARLEGGKVGEDILDGLATADCVSDTVERYAGSGDAIAVAASFDILTGRQIARSCL